jgi:hypothetical protein
MNYHTFILPSNFDACLYGDDIIASVSTTMFVFIQAQLLSSFAKGVLHKKHVKKYKVIVEEQSRVSRLLEDMRK